MPIFLFRSVSMSTPSKYSYAAHMGQLVRGVTGQGTSTIRILGGGGLGFIDINDINTKGEWEYKFLGQTNYPRR